VILESVLGGFKLGDLDSSLLGLFPVALVAEFFQEWLGVRREIVRTRGDAQEQEYGEETKHGLDGEYAGTRKVLSHSGVACGGFHLMGSEIYCFRWRVQAAVSGE